MTTATDYQNTYGLITLLVLGLILTYILEMYWPLIRGRIEGMFSDGIPIAISEVRLPVFSNYTGFFKEPDPDDNLAWHSDIIDIANVSETKSVSLKIFLRIKSKASNLNIRLLADGMGGPANQYRWDEHQITEVKRESEGNQQHTSYKAVSTGRPPPNMIRCPLKLGPQDSINSKLIFFGDSVFRKPIFDNLRALDFSIEIEDHISGNKAVFPVPGSYRGKS